MMFSPGDTNADPSGLIEIDPTSYPAPLFFETVGPAAAQPGKAAYLIRRCEVRDAAALFDLFGSPDYQRAALPEPFASVEALADWLKVYAAGGFQVVAECGQSVVGFAGLYPYTGRQNHAGFFTIGVRPTHQRRGIGACLLRQLLLAADTWAGLRRVELTVLADNAPAISLYTRFGFAIEGRHRCFVREGDGFVDGLTMARVRRAAAA